MEEAGSGGRMRENVKQKHFSPGARKTASFRCLGAMACAGEAGLDGMHRRADDHVHARNEGDAAVAREKDGICAPIAADGV